MKGPENSDAPHTLSTSVEDLNALHGIHYEMPTSLDAFFRMYARPQLRYAATLLGDEKAARTVVHRLYTHLALNWSAILLQEGGPEAYAWRALKLRVESHLRMNPGPTADGRSTAPANARTTAVHEAVRATLNAMREQLRALESPLGLYTAIAALPERQFDVIILQYVLGYPAQRVASIMGIHASTVRAHRRQARKRIATKLGLDLGDDEEKE
ncbi:sigma-70 family RNA polymerase sigma factor [Streptomyces aureocirculatus]|uniref:sigma-70 family RNA polymerase sigma factor n=3 Tax=Streptomyces aureocirculatus TaxID=67275 RepID=UPI00068A3A2E|nr:sigma-70 family RNA polymerase sigma factor [Streptomyces aureocirculatus]